MPLVGECLIRARDYIFFCNCRQTQLMNVIKTSVDGLVFFDSSIFEISNENCFYYIKVILFNVVVNVRKMYTRNYEDNSTSWFMEDRIR